MKDGRERTRKGERTNAIEKLSHYMGMVTPFPQEKRSINNYSTEAGGREQVWEGRWEVYSKEER